MMVQYSRQIHRLELKLNISSVAEVESEPEVLDSSDQEQDNDA